MENSYSRPSNFKLLNKSNISAAIASFSRREWALFGFLLLVFFGSGIWMLETLNRSFMVNIPSRGGKITEGIVGTPRFINPVLATSLADQDLVSLLYSGLMRKNPDGTLSGDLALRYEMSPSGLNYTFTLKNNIYFHDGTPVTVDDVIFTISKVRDGVIKSPQKVNWDAVTTVEKLDEKTLVFTLKQPHASFLENVTLGIMPRGVWDNDSPIELNSSNTEPIGSGPYMIKNVYKESSGTIDYYELESFDKFTLGEPYIPNLTVRFYPNETELLEALRAGEVDQVSSITPKSAEALRGEYELASSVLPRIFGLFFNQNQNQLFIDKAIVKAIGEAINKERIINDILAGHGVAIDHPIPPNMAAYQKLGSAAAPSREEVLAKVESDLAKAGWKRGPEGFLEKTTTDKNKKKTTTKLEFAISTGNAPELAETALLIQEDLQAIGMKVDIKTFEVGNLNQGVIRPRKYDALLFGQIINDESDLFAFWHSSQRKDPGLNVAMYTNAKVDKILEEAYMTTDEEARVKKYVQFEEEIKKDMPAVFLYSPNFIYVVSKDLKGITLENIVSPGDRFLNVYSWYTDTEDVWKIFARS